MAKTIINLSDPVSTLVEKTNLISTHLGDIITLNVGAAFDSDVVQAINYVNEIVQKTDSDDIIGLIKSSLQKDSANGIGFDSSEGRFFVPSNTINTAMIENNAINAAKINALAVGSAELANTLDLSGKSVTFATGEISNGEH